jgi:dihydrofolate reductase
MLVSIIVAMDEHGGIGLKNQLPWRLSSDLKRFKALTMGHHLILGRKTYESLGRPLPGRKIIVVTRQAGYAALGCLAAGSLEEALSLAEKAGETEAFIAGGAEIYVQALPLAQRIYLTRVHAIVQADAFFPPLDPGEWAEGGVEELPAGEKDQFATRFSVLERNVSR